jgi:pimeloyl-ACP methyl ester carboxylesterase
MKEKIYLLPGLMTDERLWSRLSVILKDKYELIHIPLPNFEDFDKSIKELNKVFEDEQVNLLGFSLGSYLASYYALKNPHKVNRVFNISGTPSGTKTTEIEKRRKKVTDMQVEGFKPLGYEKAKSLLEIQDDEELIFIVEDMFNSLGKDSFITQMNSTFNRIDMYEELKNLKIPIWYFYSIDDRLLNKKSIKEHLLEGSHHFNIISREGTSHNIPLEFPEELAEYIKQWLR